MGSPGPAHCLRRHLSTNGHAIPDWIQLGVAGGHRVVTQWRSLALGEQTAAGAQASPGFRAVLPFRTRMDSRVVRNI